MSRAYSNHPRVGVGAVVLRGSEVLLVQRGREPVKGSWSLPGGLLELGETLAQGVCREVQEECGIEIETGPVVGVFELLQRDDERQLRYHYVVVDLLGYYVSGDLRPADDAADCRWVPLDALTSLSMLPETVAMIYRALLIDSSALSGLESLHVFVDVSPT